MTYMSIPNLLSKVQQNSMPKFAQHIALATTVALLAACSPNNTTTTNAPTETTPSQTTSEQITPTDAGNFIAAIPNVKDISEIQFVQPPEELSGNGSIDAVNDSATTTHEVTASTPITVAGWAIIPAKNRPANQILLTIGEDNKIIGVATVDQPRPDVATALKNPAVEKSGWVATVDPSLLPAEQVTIKAWAYDAETKEANLLKSTHTISVK